MVVADLVRRRRLRRAPVRGQRRRRSSRSPPSPASPRASSGRPSTPGCRTSSPTSDLPRRERAAPGAPSNADDRRSAPLLGGVLVAASGPGPRVLAQRRARFARLGAAHRSGSRRGCSRRRRRVERGPLARPRRRASRVVRRSRALLAVLVAWNARHARERAASTSPRSSSRRTSFDAGDFGFGLMWAAIGPRARARQPLAPALARAARRCASSTRRAIGADGARRRARPPSSPNVWVAAAVHRRSAGSATAPRSSATRCSSSAARPTTLRGRAFTRDHERRTSRVLGARHGRRRAAHRRARRALGRAAIAAGVRRRSPRPSARATALAPRAERAGEPAASSRAAPDGQAPRAGRARRSSRASARATGARSRGRSRSSRTATRSPTSSSASSTRDTGQRVRGRASPARPASASRA